MNIKYIKDNISGVKLVQYQLPPHINNAKDLDIYEKYLKRESNETTAQNDYSLLSHLKNNIIGKTVKIECLIGCYFQTKIGTLINVGVDFLEIKVNRGFESILIPVNFIKYISVINKPNYSPCGKSNFPS